MTKCVTIVPSVCHNWACCWFNSVTLRTHQATCDSEFHFIDHHSVTDEHKANSAGFKKEVEAHGGFYHYAEGPFNVARYYNLGLDLTKSEYYVFASADMIFYPGWLDALYKGWSRNPHFFSIHPWNFSLNQTGLCFRDNDCLDDKCVECDHPPGWLGLYRRDSGYKTDEDLRWWENDVNYWYWLKAHKRVSGLCYASRVDNYGKGISNHADPVCYDDYQPWMDCEALKRKWPVIPDPVVTGIKTV